MSAEWHTGDARSGTVMISVLYVDDEPAQCEIVKRYLEMGDEFIVDTFGSAAEALALESLSRYDAIVSDFQLVGMDGIGFLQRIRSSGSPIPFIVLSGRGREETVIQALNEGADFYLRKGGNPGALFADLKQKIRTAVERRRAERSVREHGEKYRQLCENAAIGIYRVSTDGRFLEANTHAARILGYDTAGELIRSVTDVGTQVYADPARRLEALRQLREQGAIMNFEAPCRHRDGHTVWLSFNARVVRDRTGTVLYHEGTSEDITERRNAGEGLRIANRNLALLTGITRHDISNQILVLNSLIGLMQENLKDSEKVAGYLVQAGQAARMIGNHVSFAREYEELGRNAPVWQNVEQSVAEAVRDLSLSGTGLDCTGLADIEILADSLFPRVLFDLVDNSLRHGGASLDRIRFFRQETSGGLVIVCEDNGSGVPADEKERIFDRTSGKNTGTGLFLARQILDITGISVRETGEPGKGARFEMTVPAGMYRFGKGKE